MRGGAVILVADATAPAFWSAEVDGSTLTVAFSEDMDTAAKPASSVFTVTVAGTSRNANSSYTLSGNKATLTLASAVTAGQAVTVAYAKPAGGTVLQDVGGTDLASFAAQEVTNKTGRAAGAPDLWVERNSGGHVRLAWCHRPGLGGGGVDTGGVQRAARIHRPGGLSHHPSRSATRSDPRVP